MSLPARAAVRAADALNYIAARPHQRLTLTDLVDKLDGGKASIHGVLQALMEAGFLLRDESDKSYRLGPAAIALGSAALDQETEVREALDAANRIGDELGVGVSVWGVDGRSQMVLGSTKRVQARLANATRRIPLLAPFGAVHMAWRPGHEMLEWLDRSRIPAAGEEAEAIRRALGAIRDRGWSAARHRDAFATAVAVDGIQNDTDGPWTQLVSSLHVADYLLAEISPDEMVQVGYVGLPFGDRDSGRLSLLLSGIGTVSGAQLTTLAQHAQQLVTESPHAALAS